MALNRSLNGPTPVRYFTSPVFWLDWVQVPPEQLPKNYKVHWLAYYRGKHVGEFFLSKSRRWWLVIFDRYNFTIRDCEEAKLFMVALCIGNRH